MAKSKKIKSTMDQSPMMASPSSDEDWKHESNARTVMDAHEIMGDPEKMKGVKKHLKKKKLAIKSVDDLIKYRNAKFTAKDPNGEEFDEA